jgi:formylglycine-generating enzyme required for sulfatase activity/serine/threonine protein kinase
MRFVAQAVLKELKAGEAGKMVALVLANVVKDLWEAWGQHRTEDQRRSELVALAQVSPPEMREQVSQLIREVAAGEPEAVRQHLTTYLACVPPTISRSLKALAPLDTTLSAPVAVKEPQDLLLLFPGRIPRFTPGDQPLPGVDLELTELLGVGGFGEVWKACNPHFDGVPPVVLKFCLDPTINERLLRHEARVLNQVMRQGKHPGIVPLLRTYLTANPPCLEYEFVEGGNLSALVRRWQRLEGGLTPLLAARIIGRLADIIAFAHRLDPPIVHRDLKPANILIHRTSDKRITFRITDFGIGGLAASSAIEESSRLGLHSHEVLLTTLRGACTPLYASPQQLRGEFPDPRDDVYSLGVIWYQLLVSDLSTGRPGGTSWTKRLSEHGMPADFLALLGSCLEDFPSERPADAGVLSSRLAALLRGSQPVAAEASPPSGDDDLAMQVQRTLERVARGQEKALDLAIREHDYAAAAKLLQTIPVHLRDAVLYKKVCEKRDRVIHLDRVLQEHVQAGEFDSAALVGADLLQLQPHRADVQRLLDALPRKTPAAPAAPAQLVTNSLGMKFKFIPAGDFLMGSPEAEVERGPYEGPQHAVTITRPYYLGIFPVTQAQFQAVMGSNPSAFASWRGGTQDHPVEQVCWEEAAEFCRRLSAAPAEKEAEWAYRLPTEAEWERACRARTTTPFSFGTTLSSWQANFNGQYPYGAAPPGAHVKKTTKVGSFQANAFGLHDMHGNVWEWCADYYDEIYYATSPPQDPVGPPQGHFRMLRGGSWDSTGAQCRSAARKFAPPDHRTNECGFRVVLVNSRKS